MPVYWKPKYATRGQRHRAWVRQQTRREETAKHGPSLRDWLRARFRR